MFLRLPLAWMKDKGWKIFWLRMKDERWKAYCFRIWNRIVKTITSLILYLSVKRSFILWGVNFNKAEVISMHLCFHSKTAAKVPLFSETAKQNLHFANSHLAKCRNVLSISNWVREGYYLTISFICHFDNPLSIYQFTNCYFSVNTH